MKTPLQVFIFLVIASLFVSAPCKAQSDRAYYEAKLYKFKGMRTTGMVFAASGIGLAVIGVAKAATLTFEEQYDPMTRQTTYVADDPKKNMTSLGCIVMGIPLAAAGTVFTIVGHARAQSYNRRLKNISVVPTGNGLYLSYRF